MPSSRSNTPREVAYVLFVEIIHGRWIRMDLTAPSPQGAVSQARRQNLNGRAVAVKANATYEFAEGESEIPRKQSLTKGGTEK